MYKNPKAGLSKLTHHFTKLYHFFFFNFLNRLIDSFFVEFILGANPIKIYEVNLLTFLVS
jgi:hypothetical protein